MKFKTSIRILLLVILKVMQAEPVDPCQSIQDEIIADMCTDDSVVEDSNDGSKGVDSVILRISKKQNNCTCHVTLHNPVTNYTIYMSKYEEKSSAAPVQQNCGLAVDVDDVDTSDTTRSLQPIECTIGTEMRSITLEGNKVKLRSRIIKGDFDRGYCMQIFRNQPIISCEMKDHAGVAGRDKDWIATSGSQHTSFKACKIYCLQTEDCVAVHYGEGSYCFIYNTTTILVEKDDSFYSQKHCFDTQKLKVSCYPPESTTETDQSTSTEETFTTTVTNPIHDNHVTISTTRSTIEKEKETIKDTSPSFLAALVIAIIGCTVAVIFAGTTLFYKRQLLTQKSKSPLAPSANYVDLSGARDVSDYSAINTKVMNEQYETVNDRT